MPITKAEHASLVAALRALDEIPDEREEEAWTFVAELARILRHTNAQAWTLEDLLDTIHDAAHKAAGR